jgi:hypothetical protein
MSSAQELSLREPMHFVAVFMSSLCFKFTRCQSIGNSLGYVSLDLWLPSALVPYIPPDSFVELVAVYYGVLTFLSSSSD